MFRKTEKTWFEKSKRDVGFKVEGKGSLFDGMQTREEKQREAKEFWDALNHRYGQDRPKQKTLKLWP